MRFFRTLFRGNTGIPGPPGPQGIQGPPGQVIYEQASDCDATQERDVARQECDRLKGVVDRLQKVAEKQQREINQLEFSKEYFENETKRLRATARQEMANPRLEAMLEESYRNEFKRNIDNQKSD